MKLMFSLFFGLLIGQTTCAQWTQAEQEINDQVWFPFMQTYDGFDAEGFMAIHTEDVVRVSRDGRNIRIGDEYGESVRKGNARSLERKRQRSISFSFLERIISDDTAFEVGYYKVESSEPGKEPRTSIGKFHVVLKKENGNWRIAMDSDTSADGSFTSDDFDAGKILQR